MISPTSPTPHGHQSACHFKTTFIYSAFNDSPFARCRTNYKALSLLKCALALKNALQLWALLQSTHSQDRNTTNKRRFQVAFYFYFESLGRHLHCLLYKLAGHYHAATKLLRHARLTFKGLVKPRAVAMMNSLPLATSRSASFNKRRQKLFFYCRLLSADCRFQHDL